MSETLFRLNVWRPARIERSLMYENRDANGEGISELQEGHLHEQIYSWRLGGDVWTALRDDDDSKNIKKSLTTGFECGLPPNERGFGKMGSILTELRDYLTEESNRSWQMWDQLTDEDDQDSAYQVQPLLALYHHLQWLCDVFQDVPGASVTIR